MKFQPAVSGTFFGALAYLIWGLSPIYWKELNRVPAFEIITHRIVWSFLFLFLIILASKQIREFIRILFTIRMLLILVGSALLVSINWLVYIWSVNNGYILQASLGYYINPLVNVLLGVVFLGERLRRARAFAVGLAFIGVLNLTIFYNTFPWISLTLAFSFGFYGLIRKTAAVNSLVGLTIETLVLSLPAIVFLVAMEQKGVGHFGHGGWIQDMFLVGTAIVTALPLLLFNLAGKRLMLATLGFLQYLAPTCMFLIGVFVWGETIVTAQLISFGFIWTALACYSLDSALVYRNLPPGKPKPKSAGTA